MEIYMYLWMNSSNTLLYFNKCFILDRNIVIVTVQCRKQYDSIAFLLLLMILSTNRLSSSLSTLQFPTFLLDPNPFWQHELGTNAMKYSYWLISTVSEVLRDERWEMMIIVHTPHLPCSTLLFNSHSSNHIVGLYQR